MTLKVGSDLGLISRSQVVYGVEGANNRRAAGDLRKLERLFRHSVKKVKFFPLLSRLVSTVRAEQIGFHCHCWLRHKQNPQHVYALIGFIQNVLTNRSRAVHVSQFMSVFTCPCSILQIANNRILTYLNFCSNCTHTNQCQSKRDQVSCFACHSLFTVGVSYYF